MAEKEIPASKSKEGMLEEQNRKRRKDSQQIVMS